MRFGRGLCLAISGLALFSLGGLAFGQTGAPGPTKIAFINMQQAVLGSAEIKKASAEMEAKFKPRAQQLEKLQRDLANIQQQLENTTIKLTPQQQADLQLQGQRKQREAQRVQEDLQADVDRERNEILSKSTQKMAAVVKKMAEEKGLDVVADVTTAIYFNPSLEITSEAIAAYDKAYPAK